MFIKNLILNNFKSFESLNLDFKRINCIVGDNGVGKTNVLEAIYYLSFCKSFLSNNSQPIRYGKDFFSIKGEYVIGDDEVSFLLSQKEGERKILKKGSQVYKRFSEHIGELPCVIVSPLDQELISGYSEERRRLVDIILCQVDAVYLEELNNYNKCLMQRNKLLKIMQERGVWDDVQLDIWNEKMGVYSDDIQKKRREFFEVFQEVFKHYYSLIASEDEEVRVEYSTYEGPLKKCLEENSQRDKVLGYTTKGVHRDDLLFYLKNHIVKTSASQGQQKSFTLALKLSQMDYLKKVKGKEALLLLDDIFDKFDFKRVERILDLVAKDSFNQVFITDTHPDRVEKFLSGLSIEDCKIAML